MALLTGGTSPDQIHIHARDGCGSSVEYYVAGTHRFVVIFIGACLLATRASRQSINVQQPHHMINMRASHNTHHPSARESKSISKRRRKPTNKKTSPLERVNISPPFCTHFQPTINTTPNYTPPTSAMPFR